MTINLSFLLTWWGTLRGWVLKQNAERWVFFLSMLISIGMLAYSYHAGIILDYGDAESHLDIAKRVVNGLTPGLAQLGGIWLPLPHLLMLPFIWYDPFWRSGLAGSFVSVISFWFSSLYIFKLVKRITQNTAASFVAFLVFALNLNVLYMQSTPMTELPLILFLTLSTYYFVDYLFDGKTQPLIMAGMFGFAASLARYDGWFLVGIEGLLIFAYRFPFKTFWSNIKKRGVTLFTFMTEQGEGEAILFATVALIGIVAWFVWGYLILGDPLYFTNSQFSAKSQQQGFQARGELPAFHDMPVSLQYYSVTTMATSGILVFVMFAIASVVFLRDKSIKYRVFMFILLMTPFIFNALTLFMGQSIIFIPHLTPVDYQWRLFNVRYGLMMIPAIAVLMGYLFARMKSFGKTMLIVLLVINMALYGIGYARIISYDDGLFGLSHASHPDAELWLAKHYDNGLVLMDDFARTISIIGSGIPMQNTVYVGSHLYWDEALKAPQRRMKWVVMQKDDSVWKALYDDERMQKVLYTYFHKVYSSDTILIFERDE